MTGSAVLLLACVFGALQTGAARHGIERAITHFAPEVRIAGLSGTLPFDIRATRIEVADARGVWLTVDRAHLAWHPLAALAGRWHVTSLAVERIALLRPPLSAAGSKPKASPGLPKLPSLRVDALQVARLDLAPALTGGVAESLRLGGALSDTAGGTQIALHADTLEGPPTSLRLDGVLGDRVTARLALSEAPGGALGHAMRADPSRAIAATLDADGTLAEWHAKALVQEAGTPLLDLTASAAPAERATLYHATWSGNFPSRLTAAVPALAPLGRSHRGEASLTLSENGALDLTKLDVAVAGFTLSAHGRYENEEGPVALDLLAKADSLAPFAPLFGQPVDGSWTVDLDLKGRMDALAANLHVTSPRLAVTGHVAETLDGKLHAIIDAQQWRAEGRGPLASDGLVTVTLDGEPLSLHYGGTREADGRIVLKRVELVVKDGTLEGEGSLDPNGNRVSGALSARRLDIALLAPGRGIAGDLGLRATLSGTLEAMQLEAAAEGSRLHGLPGGLDRLSGGVAKASAKVRFRPSQEAVVDRATVVTGPLSLSADGRYRFADASLEAALTGRLREPGAPPLDLAAHAALKNKRLDAREVSLTAPGMVLKAEGSVDLATKLLDAKGSLIADDLGALTALAGEKVGGKANVDFSASNRQGRQAVAAKGSLDNVIFGPTAIAHADLSAHADDVFTLAGVTAEMKSRGVHSGNTQLAAFQADVRSIESRNARPSVLSFTTQATGSSAATPFSAKLAGDWQAPQGAGTLHLASLGGRYGQQPFALQKPADIHFADQSFNATPIVVTYGGGRLSFAGGVTRRQAHVTAAIDALPLASLPGAGPALPGTLSARLAVTGPAAGPQAVLSADLHTEAQENAPPASLHADVTAQRGRLNARSVLQLAQGSVQAEAQLPLRFSMQPFAFDLPPGSPLAGSATLALPLDSLNSWLRPAGHQLGGRLDGTLHLGGTVAAPDVRGSVTLADASYEGLDSGVCLHHVDATVTGNDRRLELTRLTAHDDHGGQLDGHGSLALDGGGTVALDATLRKLQLLCRGPAVGEVAGHLGVNGHLADLLVAGDVTLGPLTVNLPDGPGSSIPEIRVVRKGQKSPSSNDAGAGRTIRLKIALDAPDRIFVRGRGLDAEFGGKLAIGGTAAKPEVVGTLSTRRGRFDLLDRPLTLTRANLTFGGPIPPSPFLDIAAETKVNTTTIDVTLSGTAMKPTIALTSTPALPQDELLAQLLFGRDLKSISAFQAIQLAQAAATLAGKNGGPGMLDKARNLLGVDTLSVDQGTNGGTSVGAGKYISDKVFVGIQQGATPDSRAVKTEIEVTPHVSAGTTTDAEGRTGASLNWKWDY